ncbi:high affinity immunoglobulin gamma Fc receptor I-like isoform X2 [Aquarana catesbeiana]|uniref:high affinity immunoglobulin gamma Fc receptor I-like isoform X2 n=1 Tax=Aquarana catesbeiana TaxID=8400 RepID=UPI003CCA0554
MLGVMCRLLVPCQFSIIIYLTIGKPGSSGRPVLTFTPNWNKILTEDSIKMSCHGDRERGDLTYLWYKNNERIHGDREYNIHNAQISDSGDYQCQVPDGDRSECITLNVTDGPVVLQTPVYVYEGDTVSLRCYSRSRQRTRQTTFYKNQQILQTSMNDSMSLDNNLTDRTAIYRCTKEMFKHNDRIFSDEIHVSYTEDTGRVLVTFTPNWNKFLTGDNITMTCHGGSDVTYQWLQNGTVVAEEKNYTITSAQVGHSGIYQCRTNLSNSASFRLNVIDGPVILQAPSNISQGKELTLRCHSPPGYVVYQTKFYKDNVIRRSGGDGGSLILPESEDVSGRYRCEKRLFWDQNVIFTDEASIPIIVKENNTEHLIFKIAIPFLVLAILIIWAVLLFTSKSHSSKRQMVKSQRVTSRDQHKDEETEHPNITLNKNAPSTEEEEISYAKLVITKKGARPKDTNNVIYSDIKSKMET